MTPLNFAGADVVLGPPPDWDEVAYGACGALAIERRDGVCISRWTTSWRERLGLLFGRPVHVHIRSGPTQPPIKLTVG